VVVDTKGDQMLEILLLALIIESLVELFFKAAPLQGIRQWLIRHTPFLTSVEQGNLFDCKYCVSFWIAIFVLLLTFFIEYQIIRFIGCVIIVARLSNFIHILYSTIRDAQLNMRLGRK
jgi:hypothetical protein